MASTLAAESAPPRAQRSFPIAPIISLGIPTLVLVLFFVLPIVLIGIYSFYSLNPDTGLMQQDFTWANYERALTSNIYRNIFFRTLGIATLATVIALVMAYPMGYYIGAVARPRYQDAADDGVDPLDQLHHPHLRVDRHPPEQRLPRQRLRLGAGLPTDPLYTATVIIGSSTCSFRS